MIYLIQGRPKSGKSYEAVKYHIIPAVKSGRKVITNLPLDVEHFVKIFGAQVRDLIKVVDSYDTSDFDSGASNFHFSKPEHYMDEWRDENNKGPLFVVDECHFALPRGKVLPEVIKYFTMHGHYGVDILLLTQNVRQTDTNILNLVEVMYRTIKNTALGSTKTYTKKVLDGYRGAVVNTEQRKYDSKIFPFYKAFTGSQGAVEAAGPNDVKPIWKHWSLYGAVICLVFVIYKLSQGNINPFGAANAEEIPETKVTAIVAQPAPKPVPVVKTAPVQQIPKEKTHPFSKVNLHISGWSDNGYFDDQGKFTPDYRVYFSMSRNGQPIGEIKMRDLLLAGYDVSVLGECLVRLQYEQTKYDDFILCDTPAVSMGAIGETASL